MKLSVVMSVYNDSKTVSKAVESILNQTFTDFEFIIINDGSTDNTASIIKDHQRKDKRIVFFNNDNFGLARSLNLGIKNAKGEYIARQDADDISLPDRFKYQIQFLDRNRIIGFVGCNCVIIDTNGSFLNLVQISDNPKKNTSRLKNHNIFCHGSMMFRKELLNKISGYREFFKYAQDYDLYLRLIELSQSSSLKEVLYAKTAAIDSISIQQVKMQYAYAELARRSYALRIQGKDDSLLLSEEELSRVQIPLSFEIILPFMKGLDYFKKGNAPAARACIKQYLFPFSPKEKFKLYLLFIVSFLPSFLISLLFKIQRFFKKIKYGPKVYNYNFNL